MSVNTYTPDSTKIIHNTSVDFVTRYINSPIHLVQFDNSTPVIAVKLYSNGTPYVIPAGMNANVKIRKPDRTVIYNPVLGCNPDRDTIYIEATTQMCAVNGDIYPVVEIADLTTVAASGYFYVEIDKNPVNADDIQSTSEAHAIQEFVDLAESWAIGGTGTRTDEDTNNSKYWSEVSANYEADAQIHANNANTSSINSSNNAANAKISEEIASDMATLAESWAIGGTSSRSGEDTNNAKYYSEQSGTYSSTAASKAILAESWAIGGTSSRSGEDTNNSSYFASQASSSASNANLSAIDAINNASTATSKAILAESWAIGGTSSRSGEDTNNAKYWADQAKSIVNIDIATTSKAGIVKPDGSTISVDTDGTIHAIGGGGGSGTSDYPALTNKPKINNIELTGNKTSSQLGLVATGDVYTKAETITEITNKINDLDVSSVGGTGKVITTISESNGKINATSTNLTDIVDGSNIVITNDKINLHSEITTKIAKLDKIDVTTSSSTNDGDALSWDSNSNTFKPQTVKGGHDMYKNLSELPTVTDSKGNRYIDIPNTDEHVLSAHVITEIANKKTYRIIVDALLTEQSGTGIGTWCTNDAWSESDTADWIGARTGETDISNLLKITDNDEDIDVNFLFETDNNEPIFLGGYQLDTTRGRLCIKFGNTITVNNKVAIDVTKLTKMN